MNKDNRTKASEYSSGDISVKEDEGTGLLERENKRERGQGGPYFIGWPHEHTAQAGKWQQLNWYDMSIYRNCRSWQDFMFTRN